MSFHFLRGKKNPPLKYTVIQHDYAKYVSIVTVIDCLARNVLKMTFIAHKLFNSYS